jgi:DNA-binding protein HU-beta
VNKGQLIEALESRLGGKKAAAAAVETVLDVIIRTVSKGEKVGITGFGTFERAARAARIGRNPRTGASVKIKKTAVPKFKAGTKFRAVVADPKKLPKTSAAGARASAGTSTASGRVVVKTAAKKATAKKATAKKAAPAKKAAVTKTAVKKAAVKKAAVTKTAVKKTAAKKTAPAKKAVVKKTAPAKKAAVKTTAVKKTAPAKKAAVKTAVKKTTVKKTAAKKA